MKVLKFGGTSVGTVESLRSVKAIVESCDEPVIVVVSALGGITDQLINTAKLAAKGDIAHLESYARIVDRHRKVVEGIVPESDRLEVLSIVPQPNQRFERPYPRHCGKLWRTYFIGYRIPYN